MALIPINQKEPETGRLQLEDGGTVNIADIMEAVYDAVNGVLKTSCVIEVSDIQIGAVEVKNSNTGDRMKVNEDGSINVNITEFPEETALDVAVADLEINEDGSINVNIAEFPEDSSLDVNAASTTATLQDEATTTVSGTEADTVGKSNIGIQITGTTTSATVIFEGSIDGTNWVSADAIKAGAGYATIASQTAITSTPNEVWSVDVKPFKSFRARISAIGNGNVTVTANSEM